MFKLIKFLLVAVVAIGATYGLSLLQFTQDLENATIDLRILAFAPETEASDRVVMVWLDEDTMSKLPYRSPVPRDFLRKLNDQLAKASPTAVAYDIYFKDPSFKAADRALAKSLSRSNAYAVEPMRNSSDGKFEGVVDPPMDLFMKALKGAGLADLPIGAFDTKVRKARFSYDTDKGATPTLAALLYETATGTKADAAVHAGSHFTPYFGDDGSLLIRYAGPPSTVGAGSNSFKVFSAGLVADGVVPASWFKDKIVLVGAAYDDLMDAYPTPYYSRSTDFARMNGVEIHANVLSQLLTGSFYRGFAPWQLWLMVAVLAALCAACVLFLSPFKAGPIVVVAAAAVPAVAVYVFKDAGVVVPVVLPIIGVVLVLGLGILVRALAEGKQKKFIKQVFARYVPKAVVERIAENPRLATLGGENRIVTSMFTDIASFTSISERMHPTEVVRFLNEYLGCVNEVILKHGGTIDKYEGDAVIAFFNAPLDVQDHESAALRSAVEIQEATAKVSASWSERLGCKLTTRIGIHTGNAVVGNLGSEGRFDYTAIGDTINLASRLEGTNKFYGTRVLASEDAVRVAPPDVIVRPVDCVRVKGRKKPVSVFEVMGSAMKIDSVIRDKLVRPYKEAYALFDERKLERAVKVLTELSGRYPDDGPSRMLLKRCRHAEQHPNWDLITTMESK